MVPPEQSADLRDYYNKHTKTHRLDSRILARLPLLRPDGLRSIDHLGPAEPLLRAVRVRSSLVKRRTATAQRLDALVELLGPAWAEVLGTGEYNKSALTVFERYADPRALKKLGRGRPGAAEAVYLAADLARKVDPTLAERYHRLVVDGGRHHVSACAPSGTSSSPASPPAGGGASAMSCEVSTARPSPRRRGARSAPSATRSPSTSALPAGGPAPPRS